MSKLSKEHYVRFGYVGVWLNGETSFVLRLEAEVPCRITASGKTEEQGISRVTSDRETDREEPDRDRIDASDRATETSKHSHTKFLQRRDVLCTENVNALQLPNPSQGRSDMHTEVCSDLHCAKRVCTVGVPLPNPMDLG